MKVQNIDIKDDSLLSPSQKATLESYLKEAFDKAQSKAQQVAMEKTKDVLGFDPNEMLGSL
jgi:DNA-binding protein YbaB